MTPGTTPKIVPGSGVGPIAGGGEPPYDENMEARIHKLESDVSAIKADVAVILANYATKADIAQLRAELGLEIGGLRADVRKISADTLKWMIGTVISLFIGFTGLALVVSNSVKTSPAASAPIIITLPSPTVPAPSPTEPARH